MIDYQSEKISKSYDALRIMNQIIAYSGLKAAPFLKKIGAGPSYLNDIKTGKVQNITKMMSEKITKEYPEISESFIILGIPPMLKSEQAGDIRDNSVGGDLLGHGATKNDSIEIQKLMDTIATLTETNRQQSEQISKLIDIIASKQ